MKQEKIKRILKFLKTEAKFYADYGNGYFIFWRDVPYCSISNRVIAFDSPKEIIPSYLLEKLQNINEW